MSLYVRLNCNFFTHRKTAKLRTILGDDALWLPPRLWAYAAENQPDGVFKEYTAAELATLIGYTGDPKVMLEALLQAGFLDLDPLRIHAWHEHNGYHVVFAERAKHAAEVRWQKERSKEKVHEKRREETSIASSIPAASETPTTPAPTRGTPTTKYSRNKGSDDKTTQMSEAWLRELSNDTAYHGLNVPVELAKARRWCEANHRRCTRRFFINWLNRCHSPSATAKGTAAVQAQISDLKSAMARETDPEVGKRLETEVAALTAQVTG